MMRFGLTALIVLATMWLICTPLVMADAGDSSMSASSNPAANDGAPPAASPEMWLYQQEMRRYDDPQQAVRRNAERRAAGRRHRIASLKWFGLSNSRPTVNPTPLCGTYSPRWTGAGLDPYKWSSARVMPVIGTYE